MFAFELEVFPQAIAERQAYLRSLAGHGPYEVAPEPIRRRAGRVLVRFGRWVEGCRPEQPADVLAALATPTTSLAGRAR